MHTHGDMFTPCEGCKAHYEERIKKLEACVAELQARVHVDSLTGLLNREGFNDAIAREVLRLKRKVKKDKQPVSLSLIILDVDHFKRVNDTHGHPGGDEVLKETSKVIKKTARPDDYVVRWGGEEIAILCPETNEEQAHVLAERCRSAIEELNVPFQNSIIRVTVSAGVGAMRTDSTEADFKGFFVRVDKALYQAKEDGRNRVVLSKTKSKINERKVA